MKEVHIADEQITDPERMRVGQLMEHTEMERMENAAENLSQV